MRWLASELPGYVLEATDGGIGTVADLLFDDRSWNVRWIEVDTGNWLPGRRVILPPRVVSEPDRRSERLPVMLTKQQIEDSPGVGTDAPVSRQMEIAYYRYWGGAPYWSGGVAYPYLGGAGLPPRPVAERMINRNVAPTAGPTGDPDLRSTSEVTGYTIEATDGDIGHVEDFIIDQDDWSIRYMVADTVDWWPGKKVLISPEWIRNVSWSGSRVQVGMDRAAVKSSPEWNGAAAPDRRYEEQLHGHYGYRGYWL